MNTFLEQRDENIGNHVMRQEKKSDDIKTERKKEKENKRNGGKKWEKKV